MEEEGEDNVRPDDWYFVDITGKRFRLPRTMLFIGREACDVLVKVDTVDKRHAVITFDHYLERFKIKDLSTTNKTYVNQCRIPEQEYVTLNHMDTVQLGYDSPEYHIEQGCNDNQLTSTTVKLQSTMITKPDTNSKTDCQGLTERHVETCNNHNENPTLHDGPPNYILPATTLNKPVMFFAGFEDDKATTTEPGAEDSEETVVENRIISTTVSTNFFVPFDTNDDTEHEFISSQARKPQAPCQESTNEYDIYLKQEGTTNTTGLSHIHGKVKIEGEEYENSTSNDIGILINHTQSNLSDIPVQDENKNVLQEEGRESLDEEKSKAMEKPTAATVFTIDFDEDKKVKKDLNLSDHIPSRIREKLEARKKTKSPEADSAKKTTSSTKDNTKNFERAPLRSSKRLSNGVKTQESKSSDTKPTQNKTLKTQTSKKTDTRKQSTEYDSRTYKVKRNNSTTDTRKQSSTPEGDKEKRLSSSKSIPIAGKKIRRLSKSPESVASTKSSKSTGASSKVGVDKKKKLLVQSQIKSFDSETSSSRAKAKASSPSSTTRSKVTVKQSRLIEECSTSLDSSQLVDGKSYLMEKLFEGTEIIQQTITQHEAVPLTTQLSLPDDNVSNSGTYTIDDDEEEGNEEEEARQRIDEVFGVSELSQVVKEMSLQDDVYTGNLSDGSTCTPTDDIKRRSFTFDQPDNLDNKQYVDFEELKAMAIQQGGEVPLWMSQLVALTNQNLQQSSHTVSPSLDTSFSSRSPVDNGKKRPGTGRRLPPIPTHYSTSLLSQSSPLSDTINSVPENSAKHSPRPLTSKQSPKHSPVASTTSSKKPFVSSTRPNRAFELRRSNATEGSTRRKSTSSVASASPPVSRRSEPKTDRSSASSSSRTPRAKAKSTHLSNLKKELKRTSIGESSKKPVSKSQSTPASRNNSPKTLSWKRRMEYDPRKAVSEAKEKSKRLVKQSQSVAVDTVKSTSNLVRSSSCSNSEELCGLGSMKELSRSCMHKSAFSTPSPKDLRNMSPLQRSASLRIRRSTFDTVTDQDVQQNGLHRTESYNPLLVSSIYQLSLQLKSQLDKTVEKLKDEEKISVTPSPIDDFLEEPEKSQFPAWKTANNELISILKNLRRIKHQMQAVDSVLFPTTSDQTLDQIHRLSLEITEFHPIGNEEDFSDEGSPDLMEEFY